MKKTMKILAVISAVSVMMTACGKESEPTSTETNVNVSEGSVNYTEYSEPDKIEAYNTFTASETETPEVQEEQALNDEVSADRRSEDAETSEIEYPDAGETFTTVADEYISEQEEHAATYVSYKREHDEEDFEQASHIYPINAALMSDEFTFNWVSIGNALFDLSDTVLGTVRVQTDGTYASWFAANIDNENFYFNGIGLEIGDVPPFVFFETLDSNGIPLSDWEVVDLNGDGSYICDNYTVRGISAVDIDPETTVPVVFGGVLKTDMLKTDIENVIGIGYDVIGDDGYSCTSYYENSSVVLVITYAGSERTAHQITVVSK